MNSFLDDLITIAQEKGKYDTQAKLILSDIELLARIAHDIIPEYKDLSLKQIQAGIGKTEVGVILIVPGKTGEAIVSSAPQRAKFRMKATSSLNLCFHYL